MTIKGGSGPAVEPYSAAHMQMRKQFGKAKFVVDISEVERKNPYSSFDALAVRKYPKKEYSLHKLPGSNFPRYQQELVSALEGEALRYINQTDGVAKTAIPSDWCNYCPHRGVCMESYLAGELIESGLTTGGGDRRRARAAEGRPMERTDRPMAAPALSEASDAVMRDAPAPSAPGPVHDEGAAGRGPQPPPAAGNAARAEPDPEKVPVPAQTGPAAEAPEDPPSETGSLESMLRSLQEMVAENSQEILGMKRELATRRTRKEDTSRVEAILAEQERKNQGLLGKLEETEQRLAASEAQNRTLSKTVKTQDALLEERKALEFTQAESEELSKFTAIIIFDTCSIMNFPNLLGGVRDGELVVVPKDVNNELENHKTYHYYDERKIKAQRAITAIFYYKKRYPLIYADAILELVPEVYRAEAGERELADNKILSVAIRYKRYTDIPVVFITDDRSLSNKAAGEGIEVWTAQDFLAPPEPEDGAGPQPGEAPADAATAEAAEAEAVVSPETGAAAEQRRQQARTEFLAQKISAKNLKLDARQISILQNNGVKTLADFMAQTEETFSAMKTKKGMPFTARYLKEQENIRKKLGSL